MDYRRFNYNITHTPFLQVLEDYVVKSRVMLDFFFLHDIKFSE